MKKTVIIIVGPTAVGKTDLSVDIALKINGEIISADSMQIYKYMNIGSAKPTEEEKKGIHHYFVDEVDPTTPFSVSDYQSKAKQYIEVILGKNKVPIFAGGTGLYVNSIIYDMDFSSMASNNALRRKLENEAKRYGNEYIHHKLKSIDMHLAERIHPNNVKKAIRAIEVFEETGEIMKDFKESFNNNTDYKYVMIGLTRDREELYDRINKRVDILMSKGLLNEVRHLMQLGLTEDHISMKGIGYKELIGYLNHSYDLETAVELIKRNTRRYAKRQLTWFRRYDIKWYDLSNYSFKKDVINDIILYIMPQI